MFGLCGNYFFRYGIPHVGISRRDLLYASIQCSFCLMCKDVNGQDVDSRGYLKTKLSNRVRVKYCAMKELRCPVFQPYKSSATSVDER